MYKVPIEAGIELMNLGAEFVTTMLIV